jgi:hypothetical protein
MIDKQRKRNDSEVTFRIDIAYQFNFGVIVDTQKTRNLRSRNGRAKPFLLSQAFASSHFRIKSGAIAHMDVTIDEMVLCLPSVAETVGVV